MRIRKMEYLNKVIPYDLEEEWVCKKDLLDWIKKRPFCNVRKALLKQLRDNGE